MCENVFSINLPPFLSYISLTVWHPRLSALWPVQSPVGRLPSSSGAVSAKRTTSPADPPYGLEWNLPVSPGTYWKPTHTEKSGSHTHSRHLTNDLLRSTCVHTRSPGFTGCLQVLCKVNGYSHLGVHLYSKSPNKVKTIRRQPVSYMSPPIRQCSLYMPTEECSFS